MTCSPLVIFTIWFARYESWSKTKNIQKIKKGFWL